MIRTSRLVVFVSLAALCLFASVTAHGARIGLLFDKVGKTGRGLAAIGIAYDDLEHDVSSLSDYNVVILGHNGAERDIPHGDATEFAAPLRDYIAGGGFILQTFHWDEQPTMWDWMPIPIEGVDNNVEGPTIAVEPNHPIFNVPNDVPKQYARDAWGPFDPGWGSFDAAFVDPVLVGQDYRVLLVKESQPELVYITEANHGLGTYMLAQGFMDVATATPRNNTDTQKEEAGKLFENMVAYGVAFSENTDAVDAAGKITILWGQLKSD